MTSQWASVIWLEGWKPPVSQKVTTLPSLVLFDCLNGDVIGLVCHLISQDDMIKGSCDFMGESPSW